MDVKIIILVSVAFLNFALGATILTQNIKSMVNRWFAAFAFSLGFWSFSMMMYENIPENWTNVFVWSLILHLAGALIAHSFFYFSLVYPDDKAPLGKLVQALYYIPIILIAYYLFFDIQIIVGLQFQDGVRNLVYGPIYYFYFVYFFLYMGGGLLSLIVKLLKSKGIQRKRILIFLLSVILPLSYSGVINMVLVAAGDFRYAWTGPIALLIVVVSIAYGIIKYNFLDVKVIATEIFAVFMSLVALIEIFLYNSFIELVVRIILFIITIFFASLLIRSVLHEVKRREDMEKLTKELQKVTKDLKNANKELTKLDQAKSEFLSIASHQLRTPLTVIKGYVSMMLEGSFGRIPKIVKDNLNKVYLSNERLISLVESLLNISRIESGRLEFDIQPTDLATVVEPIIDGFKQKTDQKGLKFEFMPDSGLPKVLADPQKIKEVISNLIDNSIKYTNKGDIIVSLHQESQSVIFSCQDTGIGILAEDLPRLFEKFIRGKGMMQVYTEGTGLGLYFARMVIENMGGRIWAESPGKDQGSKFSFSLPIADKNKVKKIKSA